MTGVYSQLVAAYYACTDTHLAAQCGVNSAFGVLIKVRYLSLPPPRATSQFSDNILY